LRDGFCREPKQAARVSTADANKHGLVAKWAAKLSPILPISLLVTLLCALGAIEGALFQQLLFVGAPLSATILSVLVGGVERAGDSGAKRR
jgi:hypothetical protein